MKRTTVFSALSLAALAGSGMAGQPVEVSKNYIAPAPLVYGTGFYLGLQAGVNAAQEFENREFKVLDTHVTFEAEDKVGFVGGIKAGYVFGTGTVRPAIEADLYYNGVEADVNAKVNGEDTDFNASAKLHSGVLMGNFILRFALDQFQPYFGGGAGGYYTESQDAEVTIGDRTRELGGGSNSGFAWQLLGGADYYFNEKFSGFFEYKFLNYEEAGLSEDRIAQHLVVLGVRWHF